MGKEKIVIVPVHNQFAYVKTCIASVLTSDNDCTIIVVDDGSTEKELIDWYDDYSYLFTVLYNETAQGFSAACNRGIQYALDNFDFNVLCLLNSDAEVVTEKWFDKVSYFFEAGDKIGVAGVVSDNAMAQTIHDIPTYLKTIDKKPTVYCNIIHGFAYFISRDLIQTIGMFDVNTFVAYGGEDDYSLRSIKNGFNNIIVGSVFVKHKGEASYSSSVRSKFIKTTLPTLQRRWGYKYVSDCVKQANRAGQYLNNI